MVLKRDDPMPLYYQLEDLIQKKIEEGNYGVGEQIPSLRRLAIKHDLSVMTVKKAVDNLIDKGYLRKKQGTGTFVAEKNPRPSENFEGLIGFTKKVKLQGKEPSSKLLEEKIIDPDAKIKEKLNISGDKKIYLSSRIRLADDIPKAFERSYIPKSICPKISDIDLEKESIYQLLTKCGYKPTRARQKMQPFVANHHISKLLEIEPKSPLIKMERITFHEDTPVQFSINFDRGVHYYHIIDSEN